MLVAAGLGLGGGGLSAWRPSAGCEPTVEVTRVIFNLMMAASIVVAGVTVAELLLPSVRSAVAVYYETPVLPSWDPVYRPTSLLGHFSAVGAFGLMSCTLALALAA